MGSGTRFDGGGNCDAAGGFASWLAGATATAWGVSERSEDEQPTAHKSSPTTAGPNKTGNRVQGAMVFLPDPQSASSPWRVFNAVRRLRD